MKSHPGEVADIARRGLRYRTGADFFQAEAFQGAGALGAPGRWDRLPAWTLTSFRVPATRKSLRQCV